MWRPEDNLECHLQGYHQPSFKQGFLLTWRSPVMLDWLARKSQDPLVSTAPPLGLQVHVTKPSICRQVLGSISGSLTYLASPFPTEPPSLSSSTYPTFPGSRTYTKKHPWDQKAAYEANFKILGQGRQCGQSEAATGSHAEKRYRSQEIGNLIITLKN